MGSVDEVEACVRRDYARLVRAVAVVTASTPAAEDAVQEAFARAWERASRGKEFSHLAGWVATVALNLARSGRRRLLVERRARRLTAPQREENNVAALVDLDRAVQSLPGRQREAVVLHYLLDLDVATTAAVLEVSPGTVKTALSRAREKLAAALRERESDRT
jgi:RNA polymerase sigma-70 factor (ECF subfamily)